MKVIQTTKIVFSVLFSLILVVGCSNKVAPDDIDKITLELVEQKQDLHGIIYTLRMKNGSRHVIKQNNVYLYFPIKT
jgi:hypothetical protein